MKTTAKAGGRLYWCLCGLWCTAGAVTVGALLTYLTNQEIGVVTGIVMAVVLAFGLLPSRVTTQTGLDDEADLSERQRVSPVYSDVPGNRFYAE